jgi:hypothetical protein
MARSEYDAEIEKAFKAGFEAGLRRAAEQAQSGAIVNDTR